MNGNGGTRQEVGPHGRVVAMDISPRMVAAARQRLFRFANVDICLGSVERMAEQLGVFDQIICHQVFTHFNNNLTALEILGRMLKPGGRPVISHCISFAETLCSVKCKTLDFLIVSMSHTLP